MILLFVAAGALAPAAPAETVRCTFEEAPAVSCRMIDEVLPGGRHRMSFVGGGHRATFEGRAQTGWWSGRLNGAPAMGYERNRGNVVFATQDLRATFAWWYPAEEHGRY